MKYSACGCSGFARLNNSQHLSTDVFQPTIVRGDIRISTSETFFRNVKFWGGKQQDAPPVFVRARPYKISKSTCMQNFQLTRSLTLVEFGGSELYVFEEERTLFCLRYNVIYLPILTTDSFSPQLCHLCYKQATCAQTNKGKMRRRKQKRSKVTSRAYFHLIYSENVSPMYSMELLTRLTKLFKDYCGVLSEETIRTNFVLIYELLDEIMVYN